MPIQTHSRPGEVAILSPQDFAAPLHVEGVGSGPKITVNVAARRMYVYDNDKLVKVYPVAVGSGVYRTPLTPRAVQQIVWNPWWIPPKDSAWAEGEKDTPPGPHNPLGPVKMQLGQGIMIHGTNKPQSIGKAASHGCMRMYSDDARDLARWLQERVTEHTDAGLFKKYREQPRQSFYVDLPQEVPVDFVYEVASLEGERLYLYQDVYWRAGNRLKIIEELLASHGVELAKVEWPLIEKAIQDSAKADVVVDLTAVF